MNRLWTTWRTRIGCFKQIENAISLIIGRLSLVPSNFNNHKLSKYTLETPISLRFEHICHSTWRQCVAALSVFKTTPAMLLKLCRCHKGFFPSSSLKHCQRHNTQGDGVGDGGGDDEPNVPLPRDLSEHIPLIVTTNICVTTFLCRCNNKYLDITTNIWI